MACVHLVRVCRDFYSGAKIRPPIRNKALLLRKQGVFGPKRPPKTPLCTKGKSGQILRSVMFTFPGDRGVQAIGFNQRLVPVLPEQKGKMLSSCS